MTSQKSLKSNVNTRDFLRSLVGALLFPAIAFLVLSVFVTVPVIWEVINPENRASFANTVSYFLSSESFFYMDSSLMSIGMVLCGMLTAVKQFYYIMRKKQVNVYFSLGISRMRMFVNRTAAGLIALFVSVLLPMLALYITNIVHFGMSAHVTQVFLYVTMMLFISAFGGFAIGTFAVSIAGNIFEAGLTMFTTSMFGTLASSLFIEMRDTMLKGYVYISGGSKYRYLLSPFSYVMDLGAKVPADRDWTFDYYTSTYYNPITAVMAQLQRNVSPDKYKIPEDLVIDRGFIIPLIIAFAASSVFFALAAVLFKKRKAEHANSLGHFKVSSFINAAFVFTATVFLLTEVSYGVRGGWALALAIALFIFVPLLAYFLVQLILTRKIKVTLRSLIPAAALTVITLAAILTLQTGVFGIYNKTPDKSEIKSVAIDISDHPVFYRSIRVYGYGKELESGDQSDIDMVLSVFDRIKKEKYQSDSCYTYVTVAFRYKDDEIQFRQFPIYSEETYEEYLKSVYNSNYFDEYLKDMFFAEPDMDSPEDKYYYDGFVYYEEGYDSAEEDENYGMWRYLDADSLVDPNSKEWKNNVIEASTELKTHLYNDLSKMTYEQLFKNNSRPLGLITSGYFETQTKDYTVVKENVNGYWDYWEDDDIKFKGTGVGESELFIYPEMKETIAFLQEMGYELASEKHTVKEILYTDSKIQLETAASKYAVEHKADYSGYGSFTSYYLSSPTEGRIFVRDNLSTVYYGLRHAIPEDTNFLVLLKETYNVSGHPLISVTDDNAINSIMNGCVPFYLNMKDNGRYAYVIYDDGTMVSYYIPQANLGVLK